MAMKVLGKVLSRNDNSTNSKLGPKKSDSFFTEQELTFLLTKLRSASYTGNEFEQFYAIWLKLMELGPK